MSLNERVSVGGNILPTAYKIDVVGVFCIRRLATSFISFKLEAAWFGSLGICGGCFVHLTSLLLSILITLPLKAFIA